MLEKVTSTMLYDQQNSLLSLLDAVEQMKNRETFYPGTTEEIKDFCSVNRNSVDIGKAIVLAGGQTYMKSVKTEVTNYK